MDVTIEKGLRVRRGSDVNGEGFAHSVEAVSGANWGRLPELSVVGALGLLLVAAADTIARNGVGWSVAVFWGGLLLIIAPSLARQASANVSRSERIGLVLLVGFGLYLVKILHSPLAFTLSDELQHWRTANEILRAGRLFQENPILPVSPYYPGLESVADAFINLSGLTIFGAGIVVIGVARLVLMLSLYLLYEQISRSPQVAGIAAILYVGNPSFVFFNGMFSYESFALSLAVLTLAAMAYQRADRYNRHLRGFKWIAVLGVGAVVITHHITSYVLAAFLLLWTATFYGVAFYNRFRGRGKAIQLNPSGATLLAVVGNLAWIVFAAALTVEYLSPAILKAIKELIQFIAGEAAGRELFRSGSGNVAPLWERLTGFASVGLILLGLPLGALQVWQRYREKALALAMLGGALAYPVTLALRMTKAGAESAQRTSPFLFVAIVFVLAVGVVELWLFRRSNGKRTAVFVAGAVIIIAGGLIVGWPTWGRLPGPYMVGADTRSIEQQGISAAEWARDYLGPGNRMIADRTNRLLMGTYGGQFMVKVGKSGIIFFTGFGPDESGFVRDGDVHYVVFDRRISQQLPEIGIYVDNSEPDARNHKTPVDPQAFKKFDGLPKVGRLFDSGDILIYDVGVFRHAP